MPLAAGSRLGPYEIVAPIGAGGMGEVYRAKDTRLDRIVAVKVLPSHLSQNADLRQRFEREARAISQLSHPHICTLHDVGNQDGVEYLVMEYLEGETLTDRLAKGALPAEQVLRYGIQIADALDKAHRQGVVHRDLKPGNIMLTKSGVKLVDFGLAKLAAADPRSGLSSASVMPTQAPDLTAEGTILGTFQYMAPEQLEGREADVRSDIFAFGAVLYEMATGRKAFSGKSQASLIGAILKDEPPPISTVQPMTPPALDRVVKTCLAKDPDDRWQTAHDVMLQLQWIAEGGSQAGVPAPVAARRGKRERLAWGIAALAVAAALAGAAGVLHFARRARAASRPLWVSVLPPEGWSLAPTGSIAVSPDGGELAFVAVSAERKTSLWVRPFGGPAARLLADTEGASFPFWSPDGRFLGFFADGKLKKIEASGGPSQTICEAPIGRGGSWNREGTIIFAPRNRSAIYRVSAASGQPEPVTQFGEKEGSHRWPSFLPDGRHFLFTALAGGVGIGDIAVGSLDSKERKSVLAALSNVIYAPPGFLLFVREGNLMAQPFDAGRRESRGEPFLVADRIASTPGLVRADFAASQEGTIAYQNSTLSPSRLVWRDREGREIGSVGEPAHFRWLRLSPDGRRIAVLQLDPRTQQSDIWLYGSGREAPIRFLSQLRARGSPVWSPDARRVVYTHGRGIYVKPADGTGSEEKLTESNSLQFADDWSPDGQELLFDEISGENGIDMLVLPLSGERKARPVLATRFNERDGRFSPNGKWLAYISDESGRYEVYIRPYAGPGGAVRISTGGGVSPQWRRDGKELFYLADDRKLMAVAIEGGPAPAPGKIQPLFEARAISDPVLGQAFYDVSADGQRFLINTPVAENPVSSVTLLLNWSEKAGK